MIKFTIKTNNKEKAKEIEEVLNANAYKYKKNNISSEQIISIILFVSAFAIFIIGLLI